MRRLILLLAGLCGCVAYAAQPPALDAVLAELGRHHAVRAGFSQTRSNPALTTPQVSRGRLLFVVGRGMLWQTQEPYAETLAITRNHSARLDVDGRLHRMSAPRGVGQVSQMLQSLLAGKAEDVQRQFEVETDGTLDAWTLRFTPKQASVARVLAGIEMHGDTYLEGIDIAMRDGSRTEIRFTGTRDAGELSALEKNALGAP
jgi:hypothetical protein